MSAESFVGCHHRIHERLKVRYAVYYRLPSRHNACIYLDFLLSETPQAGNTTRALKILVHMAKKHKVTIELLACSRGIYRSQKNSTHREIEYYYWRALLMYQRVGFKPIDKRTFIRDIKVLAPVRLVAGALGTYTQIL